jgi:hypothetical protein
MLPQSTPALLSLKVRRTADEIIKMDTDATTALTPASLPVSKPPADPLLAYSQEVHYIHDLIERQSFSVVAALNSIGDERQAQAEMLAMFRTQAQTLNSSLAGISSRVFDQIKQMNHRLDSIFLTLAPKPIFRDLTPARDFGRITGLAVREGLLAITTASGHLTVIEKSSMEVLCSFQPIPSDSLFAPAFVGRLNSLSLFSISSSRRLLLSSPFKTAPEPAIDDGFVECFAVTDDMSSRVGFDIAAGQGQVIAFYGTDPDSGRFKQIGITKPLRGTVTQVVVDGEQLSVYALTARRTFYSVSATTFQVVGSMQFATPMMQLVLTGIFIVVSCAPNDIVLLTRDRQKFREIFRISVTDGLRRFCCSAKALFVITKSQFIERRFLSHLDVVDRICGPEAADYDPSEYVGVVLAAAEQIYLSHGNRVSFWA